MFYLRTLGNTTDGNASNEHIQTPENGNKHFFHDHDSEFLFFVIRNVNYHDE